MQQGSLSELLLKNKKRIQEKMQKPLTRGKFFYIIQDAGDNKKKLA